MTSPPPLPGIVRGNWPSFAISGGGLFLERFIYYGFRSLLVLNMIQFMEYDEAFSNYALLGFVLALGLLATGLIIDFFFDRRQAAALGLGVAGLGYIFFTLLVPTPMLSIMGIPFLGFGIAFFRVSNLTLFFNSFPLRSKMLVPGGAVYILVNLTALTGAVVFTWLFESHLRASGYLFGGLCIVGSAGYWVAISMGFLKKEPAEYRTKFSQEPRNLIMGVVAVFFLGMLVILYALAENSFTEVDWALPRGFILVFAFLVTLVTSILVKPPKWNMVVVLVLSLLLNMIYWLPMEIITGSLYQFLSDVQRESIFSGWAVGGSMVLAAGIAGIGFLLNSRRMRNQGFLGLGVGVIFLIHLVLLWSLPMEVLAGEGTASSVIVVLIAWSLLDALLLPLLYVLAYQNTPGPFKSSTLGLCMGAAEISQFLSLLIVPLRSRDLEHLPFNTVLLGFVLIAGLLLAVTMGVIPMLNKSFMNR